MSSYWENRYLEGGDSGLGSYGEIAKHKADIINNLIIQYGIKTISDFGCGDGNQIGLLFGYENYFGFDVSSYIIKQCKLIFADKINMSFFDTLQDIPNSDLCLSLDVIYHIISQDNYKFYMDNLFSKSNKYVLIFSTNHDNNLKSPSHMRHWKITDWIENNYKDFKLIQVIENSLGTQAKFFLYEKQ